MIFSLLAAEASALLAGVLGARWVNGLYAANPDIMSFPDQVPRQQQRHARLLCGLLSLLFCYTVLTMRDADAVHLAFLLFFEFFLLVYTLTDFEQQVIFDRMLVPFAAAALVSLPLLGRDIPDHLIAGAAGFAVFLVLAVATRGGIGGGAQLVADDVLRVHAAQCHADGLRLGKAGVDIAGHICPGGKAIALPGQ